MRNDDGGDDSFFGVGGGASYNRKPLGGGAAASGGGGFGKAESFGGGSRFGGSNFGGSKRSQAEQEADDFDALLDDITKPEPGAAANNPGAGQPMPTGTFRNSENDGWEDLNFGEK